VKHYVLNRKAQNGLRIGMILF